MASSEENQYGKTQTYVHLGIQLVGSRDRGRDHLDPGGHWHSADEPWRRGASNSALSGDLAVLRHAIDLYATEHGGTLPSVANINNQLAQYTNGTGATSETRTTTHIYGPYVRRVPPLPVGAKKGCTTIAAADGNDVGWLYTESTGEIKANTTTEKDDADKLYNTY